jgi:hypothetical protein
MTTYAYTRTQGLGAPTHDAYDGDRYYDTTTGYEYRRQQGAWVVTNGPFNPGAEYFDSSTGMMYQVADVMDGHAIWDRHTTDRSVRLFEHEDESAGQITLMPGSPAFTPGTGNGGDVTITAGEGQRGGLGGKILLSEPAGGAVRLEGGQVNITTPKGHDVLINGSRPALADEMANETRRALNWAKTEIAELRDEMHGLREENTKLWQEIRAVYAYIEENK